MNLESVSAKFAIVPAGGVGERFGSQKLLFEFNGKSVINHTLDRMMPLFKTIVVPTSLSGIEGPNIVTCKAGSCRAESVLNGLRILAERASAQDIVVVHDAARCCVEPELFTRVIEAAQISGVATTAIQPSDTLKFKDSFSIIDRSKVWAIQTPQAFKYGLLVEAFRNFRGELSDVPDETSLFISGVAIVEGSKRNIKLTVKDDIDLVKAILSLSLTHHKQS